MKKSSVIFVLIFFMFICSCSPLKKNIVANDDSRNEEEIVENNKSHELSDYNVEQVRDKYYNRENLDAARQDSAKEDAGNKPEAAPKPENINSGQSPDTAKPQQVKPVPLKALYIVKVDISDQKVYIYKDNTHIRTMTCSTGVKGHETPEGTFKIKGKQEWFFSEEFQQGGRHWVGFIGGMYGFHSVPTDRSNKIIQEEASKIGMPASHGCIRLSKDDAKWFFDTVPDGSRVDIQK